MTMETRNRSSYPDFPHPGRRQPSDWITKPYSRVFIAAVKNKDVAGAYRHLLSRSKSGGYF
jgi:hypothetical protein